MLYAVPLGLVGLLPSLWLAVPGLQEQAPERCGAFLRLPRNASVDGLDSAEATVDSRGFRGTEAPKPSRCEVGRWPEIRTGQREDDWKTCGSP